MQLAIATDHVDRIDLVLAAWSEAAPTTATDGAWTNPLENDADESTQLALRLADDQLPIWEARAAR